jgi:hypothetical protein
MESKCLRDYRCSAQFDVLIRYRQRRFPTAQARDLSPAGMYLQTEKLTLPTGTLIEIEFDRWGRQWFIPASVVRGDRCGVELLFRTPQPELYRLETAASETLAPRETGLSTATIAG